MQVEKSASREGVLVEKERVEKEVDRDSRERASRGRDGRERASRGSARNRSTSRGGASRGSASREGVRVEKECE